MPELELLDLNNRLKIPELPNLWSLDLGNNQLKKIVIPELPNLNYLDLNQIEKINILKYNKDLRFLSNLI